jgi:hypothetical protein
VGFILLTVAVALGWMSKMVARKDLLIGAGLLLAAGVAALYFL